MAERVLIVDDEANMRWVLNEALTNIGYEVASASGGQEALQRMADTPADLIILDLKLKGMDGLTTLRRLRERWPDVTVIILTAYGTVATAVEAMQLGAADYLRKPFDIEDVTFKLQRALERKSLQAEVQRLRQVVHRADQSSLAGSHPFWLQALEQLHSLTALDLDILFMGEAGVGKTALARVSRMRSDRQDAPLVEVDIRALTAPIQRTVIAGAVAGEGAWGRAGAGTLLLRHVEQLGLDGWTALRERLERRDARGPRLLMTATSPPATGDMHVPTIEVPPLRDRVDDLLLLVKALLPAQAISASALAVLSRYPWPGNIAELRSVLEYGAACTTAGPVEEGHLPDAVRSMSTAVSGIQLPAEGLSLEAVEIALLQQALERAGGNKTRAAELLGLTRHTLLYRLEKYGLG